MVRRVHEYESLSVSENSQSASCDLGECTGSVEHSKYRAVLGVGRLRFPDLAHALKSAGDGECEGRVSFVNREQMQGGDGRLVELQKLAHVKRLHHCE